MAATLARCWCCGSDLVAYYDTVLQVLTCTGCAADTALRATIIDSPVKCTTCGKLMVASAARPWSFTCPRCNAINASALDE